MKPYIFLKGLNIVQVYVFICTHTHKLSLYNHPPMYPGHSRPYAYPSEFILLLCTLLLKSKKITLPSMLSSHVVFSLQGSWPTLFLQHPSYLYFYPHHVAVGEWTPCAESWNWTPTLPSWHHFSCQIWGKKSSHSCCGQHPASDISAPRTYIWIDNVRTKLQILISFITCITQV